MTKVLLSESSLPSLPREAIALVNMGLYSLYRISLPSNTIAAYALRAGKTKVFLLSCDGTVIEYDDLSGIEIISTVERIDFAEAHNRSITTPWRMINLAEVLNDN